MARLVLALLALTAVAATPCSVTCEKTSDARVRTTHYTNSGHTHHRCYMDDTDACVCLCGHSAQELGNCVGSWSADNGCTPLCGDTCEPTLTYTIEHPATFGSTCPYVTGDTKLGARVDSTVTCPVDCVGAWSADTGNCSPVCQGHCEPTLTYTVTTPKAGAGDTCDHADGDTKDGARVDSTVTCPVNCVGAWSTDFCNPACGSRCQRTQTYTITTPKAGAGTPCFSYPALIALHDGDTKPGAIRTGAACQNGAQGTVTASSGPNGDDEWFAVQPAVGDTIPIGLRTYIGQDQHWGVGLHITFSNGIWHNWGVPNADDD